MPNVHVLASYADPRKGRKLRVHLHRPEMGACFALLGALCPLGYLPGELSLNFPPSEAEMEQHGGKPPLLVIDESFLRRGDLLMVLGRPPLDDDEKKKNRIRSKRGFTTLEQKVFDVCREHFELLKRDHVRLQPEYAAQLREPYQNRADVWFKQHGIDPWYKQCSRLNGTDFQRFGPKEQRTAAYLLNVLDVPSLRTGICIEWGPSGPVTLGWAHRLRTDYAHLLKEPGFTIVEISGAVVPERPTSLRFFESWKIEIVLQARPRVPVRRSPQPSPPHAPATVASS